MLKIEYLPIDELKPYKRNAKKHPKWQIEQIVKSIEEFGMNDPIAIWGSENEIIEGHGRLLACKELGYNEVPVVRLDYLTDEQRKAYNLIHNKLTMNSDFDLDILNEELNSIYNIDMEAFGFVDDIELPVHPDDVTEDEVPEPPENPMSKEGDIYLLGEHRLMCGDSTKASDVERLMKGEEADLIVTDPPYNVAIADVTSVEEAKVLKYRTDGLIIKNDNLKNDDFYALLKDAFQQMSGVMKKGAVFYIWHAPTSQKMFETALNENGLQIREQLIWVKDIGVFGRQDYHWRHEPCFYGWKRGAKHYFVNDHTQTTVTDSIDYSKMEKDELVALLDKLKLTSTTIYESKPLRSDLHPTMKPIKLLARLINNSSKPKDTVLDLFGGSGSTLIACEQMNRKCYMMELDPKYVDVIIERWEKLTGEKAVKVA